MCMNMIETAFSYAIGPEYMCCPPDTPSPTTLFVSFWVEALQIGVDGENKWGQNSVEWTYALKGLFRYFGFPDRPAAGYKTKNQKIGFDGLGLEGRKKKPSIIQPTIYFQFLRFQIFIFIKQRAQHQSYFSDKLFTF